jgi:hypothetical protein
VSSTAGGNEMRKIGESLLSAVPKARKLKAYYLAGLIRITVVCKQCKRERKQTQNKMKHLHSNGFICFECYTEGKNELLQAQLAIAQRKREIKRKAGDKTK